VRLLSARLHRNLSQPEEAARLLDEVLAAEPNRVPALIERARVAMDLNKLPDAERWLLRARELAPDQRDVNVALADCLRQALRFDEADHYQKRAQEIEERLQKTLDAVRKKGKAEKKS
jgi:tetratricopeptide (TPR) repeat protein